MNISILLPSLLLVIGDIIINVSNKLTDEQNRQLPPVKISYPVYDTRRSDIYDVMLSVFWESCLRFNMAVVCLVGCDWT